MKSEIYRNVVVRREHYKEKISLWKQCRTLPEIRTFIHTHWCFLISKNYQGAKTGDWELWLRPLLLMTSHVVRVKIRSE